MLKRKLYKACLILCSLISMSVASGSGSSRKIAVSDTTVVNRTIEHQFDSTGLCTCVPPNTKDDLAKTLRIKLNKNAAPFVNEYIKKNGFFLGRTTRRNAPYFAIIDSVFKEKGLPIELKYLAFIESGLRHNATSWCGAVGPWAFMPVAAKQYGLKMSKRNDERLDYYKSSYAATELLSDLYDKYGDWLLVIAAYNSGPGWVQKAIKRSGSRNYWTLQQFLPEETKKHVKKFIAVHYYFEGHGSLVTMTKAETDKHIKVVEAFVCSQEEQAKMDSVLVISEIAPGK